LSEEEIIHRAGARNNTATALSKKKRKILRQPRSCKMGVEYSFIQFTVISSQ
jgi:hypothetical protein